MRTALSRAAITVATAAVAATCWAGSTGTAGAEPATTTSASVAAPGVTAGVGAGVAPGQVTIVVYTPGEAEYP